MAETTPSISDIDALLKDYGPKIVVDQVLQGTPTLEYLRRNMLKVGGRAWLTAHSYGRPEGQWYDRGDQITITPSEQSATKASVSWSYLVTPLYVWAQDKDLGGGYEIEDIVSLKERETTDGMKHDMATALFAAADVTDGTFLSFDATVNDVVDNLEYATLDETTYEWWQCHSMYSADEATFATPVSPSIANIKRMLRRMQGTNNGKLPDVIILGEDYWDALAADFASQSYAYAGAISASVKSVNVGFDTLYIRGVPVISDRYCTETAFDDQGGTRARALGSTAFFLDFSHLKLGYIPSRAFKWDPRGWDRPHDYDAYYNALYFWGQCSTDSRRHLGRIWNVDVTQELDEFVAADVHIPQPA